jgi:hypothetical protein
MFHASLRRSLLALALGLILGSSAAFATPTSWGDLLRFLASGVHASPQLPGKRQLIVTKAGCSIDPDGGIQCSPAAPKAGCSIDPDGQRHCTP